MSGALLQLAALSSQDFYLTGNPEITLFKKSYLRYTNFSVETVKVTFDGGVINFGSNTQTTAKLEKTGDLISKIVLVVELAKTNMSTVKWGYVDRIGHAIIDTVSIEIGQSIIDIQYKDWIDVYQRMNKDKSQDSNYNIMIGNIPSLKNFEYMHDAYNLYIPLEFWTGKNTSSAFPICNLNTQDFNINIKLRNNITDIINWLGNTAPEELPVVSGYLLVDYVYLDTDEKQLFTNNNHDYLIEIVQEMENKISTSYNSIDLIFDKPTKYLLWYAQLDRYSERNKYMSWAPDDNWEKARDNFAKLVWLITRDGLDVSDPTNPIINFNTNYVNIGQVPPIIVGGNKMLEQLASKVNCIILFATSDGTNVIAKATTDNVILLKNEITYEDMSTTNDEFKEEYTTTDQSNFMDCHIINIIDIFNYGNFINRSDNPIIKSSFQLNGKNRFQERDGFFYNYLQSYYYYKNSPPDGINVYTFSMHPDDTQPSGILNLGYINSKTLNITLGKYNNNGSSGTNYMSFFKNGTVKVYAVAYDILKIYKGQCMLGSYDNSLNAVHSYNNELNSRPTTSQQQPTHTHQPTTSQQYSTTSHSTPHPSTIVYNTNVLRSKAIL